MASGVHFAVAEFRDLRLAMEHQTRPLVPRYLHVVCILVYVHHALPIIPARGVHQRVHHHQQADETLLIIIQWRRLGNPRLRPLRILLRIIAWYSEYAQNNYAQKYSV